MSWTNWLKFHGFRSRSDGADGDVPAHASFLAWHAPSTRAPLVERGGSRAGGTWCRRPLATFGYALYVAQMGKRHEKAKALHGFGSAGILEIVEDWRGNAYRAVYTVCFSAAVFVLHVFQKKAKQGIATPRHDVELIREQLKVAEQMAKELAG